MTRILLDATELEDLARVHRDAAAELADISALLGGLVMNRLAIPPSTGLDGPLADLRRQVDRTQGDLDSSARSFARLAEELREHAPLTRLLRHLWAAPPAAAQRTAAGVPVGHGIEQLYRLAGDDSGGIADLLRLAHG